MNFDEKWIPETLEEALLYRTVKEWDKDKLVLDNGNVLTIEMTESDCCAWAGGDFSNVELDAAITSVVREEGERYYPYGEDSGEHRTDLKITLFHNQNPIAQADMTADAGNGGYYYSVASLIVTTINGEKVALTSVSS